MDLPPKTKEILEKYLIPANDRSAHEDILLASLYMQIARWLCWNRVKIDGNEFPMVYIFCFSPSGSYKDKPKEEIIKLIHDPLKEMKAIKRMVECNLQEKLDLQARVMEKVAARKFLAENKIPRFHNTFSDGTPQAFQSFRFACQESLIGHVHYEHEELIDFIRKKDSCFWDIMSIAKESWNLGDSKSAGVLKEWREHVNGVPMTIMAHSSIASLEPGDEAHRNLLSLLESGIAKRSYIIYHKNSARVKRTFEEEVDDMETVSKNKEMFCDLMQKVFDRIKIKWVPEIPFGGSYVSERISSGKIARQVMEYKNRCFDSASLLNDPILKIEMLDRSWKAKRLSASIAAFEHPELLEINENDYRFAEDLTEKWGGQFASFIGRQREDDLEKVFRYIQNHPKTTSTEIKKIMSLRYSNQLKDTITNLAVFANEKNHELIEEAGRGKSKYYSLLKLEGENIIGSPIII